MRIFAPLPRADHTQGGFAGYICLTMTSIGPNLPFHIARAYGVSARPGSVQPQPPAPQPVQRAEMSREDAAREKLARLIAARVPGGIDFSSQEPLPTGSTLPMYRHPADRNAAATGVIAGRVIDVVG